jgi:uncharacterized SAM-binding protein YcdF (DUF218 family)
VYESLKYLLQPLFPLCLLMAGMLAYLWRKQRAARGRLIWIIILFLVLSGLCTPAASYLLLGSIEWQYPPNTDRPGEIEAIVVLEGATVQPSSLLPGGAMGASTLARCVQGARLYHRGRPCPVVVTGHDGVRLMRDFLIEQGVAESDVVVEGCSESTFENAVETAMLLKDREISRIALVTDATHLPRACRCFRRQGLDVAPSGCRYRATCYSEPFLGLLPCPGAAANVQEVMHEWLGLGWYWLRGRI